MSAGYPPQVVPSDLLGGMDPEATLVQRHLWLVSVFEWLRGGGDAVPVILRRVDALLEALAQDTDARHRWASWWQTFCEEIDLAPLLAEYGFASQTVFWTEFGHRLRRKCLPISPATSDVTELFGLLFRDARDARWLRALPAATLDRLAELLALEPETTNTAQLQGDHAPMHATAWEHTLLDALAICVGQISAIGFRAELRVRMARTARQGRAFYQLPLALESLRQAVCAAGAGSPVAREQELALRRLLDEARHAAYSVYAHLQDHGISVGIVYRVRQLRERVQRAKALLNALQTSDRGKETARLMAHFVQVGSDSRSLRALVASSTQLTAARVAERGAETGEHYITRNWAEYRSMLLRAAGGGGVLGFTTWFKFWLGGLALSAFWGGLAAGVNYALSFVLIQLLHFTVATKQPAVTAPAMVAKLKDLGDRVGVLRFVDEVAHLFRSQVAAIVGNLALVAPVVLCISAALGLFAGAPMLTPDKARHVLQDHQLFGPSVLYAAFTGLLLFASSIIAGWVENWFVLHRLDTALAYNPSITRWLGTARARRWSQFLRTHISGLSSNVSLGLMLGLVPAVAQFFGLGLEVRHVTLVTGQVTAAAASLGWEVLLQPAFWSAVLVIALVGALNLTVSFALAFWLALKARGVNAVNRQRIQLALRYRLRRAPWSFLWPPAAATEPPPPEDLVDIPTEDVSDDGRV